MGGGSTSKDKLNTTRLFYKALIVDYKYSIVEDEKIEEKIKAKEVG